jgi:hypothetical protein
MNKAIKVRKTRNGDGAIYKLVPPKVVKDKNDQTRTITYVIYEASSKELVGGFMIFPATTRLESAIPNPEMENPIDGFVRTTSLKQFWQQRLTAQKAFLNIGYKVQTKKEQTK